MRIAVLLATYNRIEKTISCLDSLKAQQLPPGVQMQIHLTDDHSSDGTAYKVKHRFPEAFVYTGTGSLFWAGGMRQSWQNAKKHEPDFYLLLNDDTILKPNAIASLLNVMNDSADTLAVGSTCDNTTGKYTYGGRKLKTKRFWNSIPVFDNKETIECDIANANILLVPHAVIQKIGILSDHFTHALADYDYTLRATRAGFRLKAVPGFLGTCDDDHGKNWKSQSTPLKVRIEYLKSPKGLAYNEYLRFIKNHFPLSYPSSFCKLWLKTLFPILWEKFRKVS